MCMVLCTAIENNFYYFAIALILKLMYFCRCKIKVYAYEN